MEQYKQGFLRRERLHELGESCDDEDCQECCAHTDVMGFICPDCGKEFELSDFYDEDYGKER